MIVIGYAVILFSGAFLLFRRPRWVMRPPAEGLTRVAALALGGAFLFAAMTLLLKNTATSAGIAIVWALFAGSLLYVCGAGLWRGRTARFSESWV
jgi:drug/metabolite transporter (DMT)-like permease